MDEWGVDVALTASQKALSLPTGLGIVCASPKALEATKNAKSVRVFFDHVASLPYFSEKMKVSKVSVEEMLFDEQDIIRSMDKTEVIDFHQTLEVNGIPFWCYTNGHVLGAAMFMADIAGVRVLYTRDFDVKKIGIFVLLSSHNSPLI